MRSPINTIVKDVQNKQTTAVEQVSISLSRARENKNYNALLSLCEERALKQAKVIDQKIANDQDAGLLCGVPFVAKDNFLTFGGETTVASKILGNFTSPLQATVVEKLERAGAICIGKSNLDSFAHGGSTENSAYGPTKNAFDTSRVAGGSSGGSAVCVALDIVPFALGTDTGGSIRQPASFNNVIGYKPTYGTVSRYGVVAMTSSTDCIGPISQTVSDMELIMSIIAGRDESDSTTLQDFFSPEKNALKKQKIGIIKECHNKAVDPEVEAALQKIVLKLKQADHDVEEISIPTLPYSLAMYYIIMPAETSSNLARYDGIRYGNRANVTTLAATYGTSRDQGFEAENKRRILIGSYVLSSGYYDAYYNQAQKARTLLINDFNTAFKNFDALLCPVAPTPAFKIGENTKDPMKMYLADIMTVAPSLAGLPAISLPAGKSSDGLPIGMQLIGPAKADARVLLLAKSLEKQKNG